jgi:hypothetical protein
MSGMRDAARKGLDAGLSAVRHAGWWLRWQTDRHACREAAELELRLPRPAGAEHPAA